jgi:hypothetical protein
MVSLDLLMSYPATVTATVIKNVKVHKTACASSRAWAQQRRQSRPVACDALELLKTAADRGLLCTVEEGDLGHMNREQGLC